MHSTRLAVLPLAFLLSVNCLADDNQPAASSIENLLAGSSYASHWQLYRPVESTRYPDRWSRPFAQIEFRDNSTVGRLSRLRNLSLLTLAESRQSRLFLGVNDDGLVGLHWIGSRGRDDERIFALARMPYLKNRQE